MQKQGGLSPLPETLASWIPETSGLGNLGVQRKRVSLVPRSRGPRELRKLPLPSAGFCSHPSSTSRSPLLPSLQKSLQNPLLGGFPHEGLSFLHKVAHLLLALPRGLPIATHLEQLDGHLPAVELLQEVQSPFLWEATR